MSSIFILNSLKQKNVLWTRGYFGHVGRLWTRPK